MVYPVSETFMSFQGEGVYTGTPMYFIRLAGCTVGKPYPKECYGEERYKQNDVDVVIKKLPIYTEKCTIYDGREFPCDTDYRVHERVNDIELLHRVPEDVRHVCITGGEPMMHNLIPLINVLGKKHKIHIETSGTIDTEGGWTTSSPVWITVSPKKNVMDVMLKRADELKFLVDKDFDPHAEIKLSSYEYTTPLMQADRKPTYLQPVNYENEINVENLKLCRMWQDKYPVFRLSPQMHKLIGKFVGEKIR